MIATEQLLEVFVEVADTLVDDFDLIDFLHTVTQRTASIAQAVSVGLVLANDDGRLRYMAASTDSAMHLALFQIQKAEGPCRSASQPVSRSWPPT